MHCNGSMELFSLMACLESCFDLVVSMLRVIGIAVVILSMLIFLSQVLVLFTTFLENELLRMVVIELIINSGI